LYQQSQCHKQRAVYGQKVQPHQDQPPRGEGKEENASMIVTFRGGSFSFALGIYPPHVPYATAQGEESACRLKEDEEWNKEDKIGEKKKNLTE
jgi:hypothetical protein